MRIKYYLHPYLIVVKYLEKGKIMHKRKAFINLNFIICASMLGTTILACITRPAFQKMRQSDIEFTESKVHSALLTGKKMPSSYYYFKREEQKRVRTSATKMVQTQLGHKSLKSSPDINRRMISFSNSL